MSVELLRHAFTFASLALGTSCTGVHLGWAERDDASAFLMHWCRLRMGWRKEMMLRHSLCTTVRLGWADRDYASAFHSGCISVGSGCVLWALFPDG